MLAGIAPHLNFAQDLSRVALVQFEHDWPELILVRREIINDGLQLGFGVLVPLALQIKSHDPQTLLEILGIGQLVEDLFQVGGRNRRRSDPHVPLVGLALHLQGFQLGPMGRHLGDALDEGQLALAR